MSEQPDSADNGQPTGSRQAHPVDTGVAPSVGRALQAESLELGSLEWTGERCVPWANEVQVIYEHLHRYQFALQFVDGKRVLDLGSGEGYGAAILADRAAHVLGVDIDEASVRHSRSRYELGNLRFERGSAVELDGIADDSFDVVVCFEVIEHVMEQADVIAEVDRVLTGDGLLLMSTPDRPTYNASLERKNPFHVRELDEREFTALLAERFRHVVLWGQRSQAGSRIRPLAGGRRQATQALPIRRRGGEWPRTDDAPPVYLVAVASRNPQPRLPGTSMLFDEHLEIVRAENARLGELAARLEEQQRTFARQSTALQHELDAKDALVREQQQALEAKDELILEKQAALEAQAEAAQRAFDAKDALVAEKQRHLEIQMTSAQLGLDAKDELIAEKQRTLEAHVVAARDALNSRLTVVAERDEALIRLDEAGSHNAAIAAQLEASDGTLSEFTGSVAMRLVASARAKFNRVAPRTSPVGRLTSSVLLRIGKRIPERRPAVEDARFGLSGSGSASLVFPRFELPEASIVIPVRDLPALTHACLSAIRAHMDDIPFEVIVVDDGSGEETSTMLDRVHNIEVVETDGQAGFIRSSNLGASKARGRYVVLLNNDTTVHAGWLAALLSTFEHHPDAGVVGAKLIRADGLIQEAGGVIWRDGFPYWHGHGHHPDEPEFNFLREVDYCSAACLAVRADLFDAIGGLDERYAPAYYEDVDLAFEARARGYKVLYQPRAVVTHIGSASLPTDDPDAAERSLAVNQPKLLAKWSETLDQHLPEGSDVWIAADRRRGARVLVVDAHVPTTDRDAGSVRVAAIVRILTELGHIVTFLPDNLHPLQPYTATLQQGGVEVIHTPRSAAEYLRQRGRDLDVCILSRGTVAPRYLHEVRALAPNAVVLFDTVDLHWVREERHMRLTGDPQREGVVRAHRELETAMARASDGTIVASEADGAQLRNAVPDAVVHVLPTIHEIEVTSSDLADRTGLLFVGGFNHPPNEDAAAYLVREILPRVKSRLPEISLHIVGADPPPPVRDLAGDHVVVTGWVPDVTGYLDAARVMVAPIRYGAGVNGKIAASMAAGLPVVTTSIGAEGLSVNRSDLVLVADEPDEFAQRVVELYTDDELWRERARASVDYARKHFSPEAATMSIERMLAAYDVG